MTYRTIAITATFTAEPLTTPLAFWMHQLDVPATIEFAPYNQVFQQLLNPDSLLSRNQNGINVVLVRCIDWLRSTRNSHVFREPDIVIEEDNAVLMRSLNDLTHSLKHAARRSLTPHLVFLCPPSPGTLSDSRSTLLLRELEELIVAELRAVRGVFVTSASELDALYSVPNYYDPHADELGHVPYTTMFYAALGTTIARKISALNRPPYKVVALDCDGTLWGGVCAEDGPAGIQIDMSHSALQEFMLQEHRSGKLLCLCSKNNEPDVAAIFENRADLSLRREHIISSRINWRPKSENLRSLAGEIRLGLDSFIFIDDDPVECAEVRAHCPDVLTIQLPAEEDCMARFLHHVWAFDQLKITEEDGHRTHRYRQEMAREHSRQSAPTFADFITGLDLNVRFASLESQHVDRVAQLLERTNQFTNSTVTRRSVEEIEKLCSSGELECLVTEASDRFGEYGLVGVLTFHSGTNAIDVQTFLLSCRALGRGVEHRMLARLGEIACSRGLERVDVTFVQTQKNHPALDFLQSVGAKFQRTLTNVVLFSFPSDYAASLSLVSCGKIPKAERQSAGEVKPSNSLPVRHAWSVFQHIASELYDPERILQAIEAWKLRPRPDLEIAYSAPRTDLEASLAELWSQVLGFDRVGIHDNFFMLGGHSLLATQLISQVRDNLQVNLSMRAFFEAPTVAGMALATLTTAISDKNISQNELDELRNIAESVELLSESSLQHLLRDTVSVQSARHDRKETLRSDKRSRLSLFVEQQADTTAITSLVFITCNRVQTLERGLISYIENCKMYGRTNDFVVLDDSPGHETRTRYRDSLRALKARYREDILYAGLENKQQYARLLVERGDLPKEVVHFALFDPERCGYSYGANRNAALLHTAGDLFFSTDDDIVCRIGDSPVAKNGVRFTSDRDLAEFWFFSDRESALRSVKFIQRDLLGSHEQCLGRNPNGIMSEDNDMDISRADSALLRKLSRGGGKS